MARFGTLLLSVSDLHTEAVQAALAKYKERKMPMPSKRRSVLVQSSVEACTPPGESMKHATHKGLHFLTSRASVSCATKCIIRFVVLPWRLKSSPVGAPTRFRFRTSEEDLTSRMTQKHSFRCFSATRRSPCPPASLIDSVKQLTGVNW